MSCFVSGKQNGEFKQTAQGNILWYAAQEPFYSGGWTSNALSRASARALGKVRELAVSMSGPTFLGELRETLRMIKRPAAALLDGFDTYVDELVRRNFHNKRKNFRHNKRLYRRNLAHIASGLWLEKAFGWDPLLNDIQDALDTYNDLLDFERNKSFSAGGKDSKIVDSIAGALFVPPAGSYMIYKTQQVYKETETYRFRGAVRMQAESTARDRLARFGFTPSEFVPTAWELLPWSFLLDYFGNIGDVLSAMVTDTSNVIWVSKSHRTMVELLISAEFDTKTISNVLGDSLTGAYGSPGSMTWRKTVMSRSAVPSIDFPTLTWRLAQSDAHLANMAALLAQVGIDLHPQRPKKRNYRL
jgi:hypothetical protein